MPTQPYAGDIGVLVLCHYNIGGGRSFLENEGMLEGVLQSRGFSGKIVEVVTKIGVSQDNVAIGAITTAQMAERNWRSLKDTFNAAFPSKEMVHSIIVFGYE
jgi:hypothetical protein